jgi:vitamin B12 transporter
LGDLFHPYSQSQETGAFRNLNLFRVKRRMAMRVFRSLWFLLALSLFPCAAASAANLKIRVVDPQSAAVSGAEVLLLAEDGKIISQQFTSAEGTAVFEDPGNRHYQLKVLAPGFGAETIAKPEAGMIVRLHLAIAAETVTVSATRTPVVGRDAGSQVDTLNGQQLTTMLPAGANHVVRFLPGAVINTAGQRGGLASLFVRGGESNYNKVIVDGVTVNEPGGTFDFGTLSLAESDRMEFVRGAQSTLYGSDAMTSVVQAWTRTGSTPIPELRFGADGGNFGTASGHASLAGARGPFDYNLFGDQFNTNGSGVNNAYSDSLQAANTGLAINDKTSLRARVRHSNSHTGVPGEWNFNGYDPLVPVNGFNAPFEPLAPNPSQWSQLNSLLGSVELSVTAPSGWQHRLTGFDYLYRYFERDPGDPQRVNTQNCAFPSTPRIPCGIDFASNEVDHINRGGFEYQGDYSERSWAHSTFGYRVENENGFVGDLDYGSQTHGQRLNQDFYAQQELVFGRMGAIVGGRFVHDSAFGNRGIPRVALTFTAIRGNEIFSGTRLRFAYSTGFKEPRLEETFAGLPYTVPNLSLKPERLRAFEAGFQQGFLHNRSVLNATYFNNLFHDQINYVTVNPVNFVGQYVNVNRAFAQGAEILLEAKLRPGLLLNGGYTYTSSQYLDNPAPFDSIYNPGNPLLRRPRHSANALLSYSGSKWGGDLGASFVGRRPDSDFYGFGIDHAAGYVRADLGGWYAVQSRVTAYASIDNALDRRYNEVVGYPALPLNFRAGVRFRIGGE